MILPERSSAQSDMDAIGDIARAALQSVLADYGDQRVIETIAAAVSTLPRNVLADRAKTVLAIAGMNAASEGDDATADLLALAAWAIDEALLCLH